MKSMFGSGLELLAVVDNLGWFKQADCYWLVGGRAKGLIFNEAYAVSSTLVKADFWFNLQLKLNEVAVKCRIFTPTWWTPQDFSFCGVPAYDSGGTNTAILMHKNQVIGVIYYGECIEIAELKELLKL